ncbi:MAG: bifunctional adenosylcobinamide kinase/adenosylcobinamide-phosphate guanylyltransferase, partial [Desertimonas sp.]
MYTLLIGGVRSGKSALAVELAVRHEEAGGTVAFLATAPRLPDDADLDARIDAHRATRPAWPTIEEPLDLVGALGRAGDALVVLDCVTLWVNNLLHRGDE